MSSDNAFSKPGTYAAGQNATTRHSHVGKKGDLTVELHYGDFKTGHKRQAALYLFRHGHEKEGLFIPLSDMWMYAEKDALHVMIPPMAKHLYGFVTQMDQTRVLDAVLDFLDDLRKSPPDPELFKDRSLDAFLQSCEDEGLEFFATVNGQRVVN
jgi:hypothetical protein